MGILDEVDPQPVDPAVEVAEQLKEHLKQTYRYVVSAFTEGARVFWTNPRGIPAEDIAAALGTSGQEVFALHWQLGQFIAAIKPEAVQEGMSLVGEFGYNEDGSVTVTAPSPGLITPPIDPVIPTPEEAVPPTEEEVPPLEEPTP
jgi:hypothetical protein